MASISDLHRVLDAHGHLPPEYHKLELKLSNHLPMALHALQSLGADSARMEDFAITYSERFVRELIPPNVTAPNEDWTTLKGNPDAFPVLRAWFRRELPRVGRDALLRRALPELLTGLAAAGFHGIIRVAHAVQSGNDRELADALAYWAFRWREVPAPTQANSGKLLAFPEWSARLVAEARNWQRPRGGLIITRMCDAAESRLYNDLADRLAPASSTRALMAQIAHFALESYLTSTNFVVLHLITGTRALRVLLPWAPSDLEPLQPVLRRAVCAAYMAASVFTFHHVPACFARPLRLEAIIADAVRSDDEHVIKLVHACREEMAVYSADAPLYLKAAALAVYGPEPQAAL